jgi:hypothetical protein
LPIIFQKKLNVQKHYYFITRWRYEIAIQLNYSSVHLSSQLKNHGLYPYQFKQLKDNTRKQIDGL